MSSFHSHLRRLSRQLRAGWKFLLSFRKHEWNLEDYPVSIRKQATSHNQPTGLPRRWKLNPYHASLINWEAVSGSGETESEARANLRARFENEKAKQSLPRPGKHVPITFASQSRVLSHQALAEDLLMRVFEIQEAWISDESSLWDFCMDETLDEPLRKIREIYHVDVSDIQSANLADILDRIARPNLNGSR